MSFKEWLNSDPEDRLRDEISALKHELDESVDQYKELLVLSHALADALEHCDGSICLDNSPDGQMALRSFRNMCPRPDLPGQD